MKKIVEEFKKKQIDTTLIERRLTARLQNCAKELTKTKKAWNDSTIEVITREQVIEILENLLDTIGDEINRCPAMLESLSWLMECYWTNEQNKLRLQKIKEQGGQAV